tara:strand:+ start:42 stop:611 length:570 start_codon:yes stop_codon:yes gene_type:complete
MTYHIPKKPSQEWLEHIENNYTYDREKGQVFNNKTGRPALVSNNQGYLHIGLKWNGLRKVAKTHHLVWFFEYGEWPTSSLDHIDGNKVNNHHTNLRQVTQRENSQAYHKSRKTSSKYTGVDWMKNRRKWRSQIQINTRMIYLGLFNCELEAASAYDKALVGQGLDPVNVKIMRNEDRMQKVMEFINDTD